MGSLSTAMRAVKDAGVIAQARSVNMDDAQSLQEAIDFTRNDIQENAFLQPDLILFGTRYMTNYARDTLGNAHPFLSDHYCSNAYSRPNDQRLDWKGYVNRGDGTRYSGGESAPATQGFAVDGREMHVALEYHNVAGKLVCIFRPISKFIDWNAVAEYVTGVFPHVPLIGHQQHTLKISGDLEVSLVAQNVQFDNRHILEHAFGDSANTLIHSPLNPGYSVYGERSGRIVATLDFDSPSASLSRELLEFEAAFSQIIFGVEASDAERASMRTEYEARLRTFDHDGSFNWLSDERTFRIKVGAHGREDLYADFTLAKIGIFGVAFVDANVGHVVDHKAIASFLSRHCRYFGGQNSGNYQTAEHFSGNFLRNAWGYARNRHHPTSAPDTSKLSSFISEERSGEWSLLLAQVDNNLKLVQSVDTATGNGAVLSAGKVNRLNFRGLLDSGIEEIAVRHYKALQARNDLHGRLEKAIIESIFIGDDGYDIAKDSQRLAKNLYIVISDTFGVPAGNRGLEYECELQATYLVALLPTVGYELKQGDPKSPLREACSYLVGTMRTQGLISEDPDIDLFREMSSIWNSVPANVVQALTDLQVEINKRSSSLNAVTPHDLVWTLTFIVDSYAKGNPPQNIDDLMRIINRTA